MDYHIAVIGPRAAGKSTFLKWLNGNSLQREQLDKYYPTLRAHEQTLEHHFKKRFSIEYPFDSMDLVYQEGNKHQVVIYVFDLNNDQSENDFSDFIKRQQATYFRKPPFFIAAMKSDTKVIKEDTFYALCQKHHINIGDSVILASLGEAPDIAWKKIESILTSKKESLGDIKQVMKRNHLFYSQVLQLETNLPKEMYSHQHAAKMEEAVNRYLLFLKNNLSRLNPDDLDKEQKRLLNCFYSLWSHYQRLKPEHWHSNIFNDLDIGDVILFIGLLILLGGMIGGFSAMIAACAGAATGVPLLVFLMVGGGVAAIGILAIIHEHLITTKRDFDNFKEVKSSPIEDQLIQLINDSTTFEQISELFIVDESPLSAKMN